MPSNTSVYHHPHRKSKSNPQPTSEPTLSTRPSSNAHPVQLRDPKPPPLFNPIPLPTRHPSTNLNSIRTLIHSLSLTATEYTELESYITNRQKWEGSQHQRERGLQQQAIAFSDHCNEEKLNEAWPPQGFPIGIPPYRRQMQSLPFTPPVTPTKQVRFEEKIITIRKRMRNLDPLLEWQDWEDLKAYVRVRRVCLGGREEKEREMEMEAMAMRDYMDDVLSFFGADEAERHWMEVEMHLVKVRERVAR